MIYIKPSISIIVGDKMKKVKMLQVKHKNLDMRKSLSRDKNKSLSKPTGKIIQPEELEFN